MPVSEKNHSKRADKTADDLFNGGALISPLFHTGAKTGQLAHQPPSLEFQHRRILPLKPYVDTLNENYMKFGFGIIHDGYISENRDYSTTLIITEGYGVYGWVL